MLEPVPSRSFRAGPADDPLSTEHWSTWLAAVLPAYCTAPFGAHHVTFWDWVWRLHPGLRPEAFVGIWARGGAKSTSAEAACVALGARRARRYGLYVCDTQDRADDHVGNVGAMLESDRVALFYPALSERRVGKHGNSRGWRRNRLWTSGGLVLDAIGLDSAARGVKLEDQRPDFLIFDDIDGTHDSPLITRRKLDTITRALLPAGSDDLAVVAIQNLIHPHGVFARLADGRADFLRRRILSGPTPAIEGLQVTHDDGRDVITAGTATWEGQSLETCQAQIDDWGYRAFRREAQHDVAEVEGALWLKAQLDACRVEGFGRLDRCLVTVDPSGGEDASHDHQGLAVTGKAGDQCYVIADLTVRRSPGGWGRAAVEAWRDYYADEIVVEGNYGAALATYPVEIAAKELLAQGLIDRMPKIRQVFAGGRSKSDRAEAVCALYGDRDRPETWGSARAHHVGALPDLEAEQTAWVPTSGWSPNRMDAVVWGITELMLSGEPRRLRFVED